MSKPLLQSTLEKLEHYLSAIQGRRVSPSQQDIGLLANFDEPLPQHSTNSEQVIQMLEQYGAPNTVASQGGRYFGFVTGGVTEAALAAKLLATAWDQNNGARLGSPIAAKLEEISLE
jgi:glutamate/tyrosine decarboxylase-like PLP-dependent enzyme